MMYNPFANSPNLSANATASSAATTANNMVAGITNGMSMSAAYATMSFTAYSSSSNTMHPQYSSQPSMHSMPGIMPVSNVAPNLAMATAEFSSQIDIQQMAMSSTVASGSAMRAADNSVSVGNGSVGCVGSGVNGVDFDSGCDPGGKVREAAWVREGSAGRRPGFEDAVSAPHRNSNTSVRSINSGSSLKSANSASSVKSGNSMSSNEWFLEMSRCFQTAGDGSSGSLTADDSMHYFGRSLRDGGSSGGSGGVGGTSAPSSRRSSESAPSVRQLDIDMPSLSWTSELEPNSPMTPTALVIEPRGETRRRGSGSFVASADSNGSLPNPVRKKQAVDVLHGRPTGEFANASNGATSAVMSPAGARGASGGVNSSPSPKSGQSSIFETLNNNYVQESIRSSLNALEAALGAGETEKVRNTIAFHKYHLANNEDDFSIPSLPSMLTFPKV